MVYEFLPDHRDTADCRSRLAVLAQRAAQNDASAARRTERRTGDMRLAARAQMCRSGAPPCAHLVTFGARVLCSLPKHRSAVLCFLHRPRPPFMAGALCPAFWRL